ncbi:MAG: D-alanyl-D-alanine carboxypeptidase/D-alanyl-D-alanine-endopeptidase [Acidobacteria bacterium]|nr:D-alanyl-D-alanine carboxypeptidase/D-alanyl-D-alanine-endopeptidase [Acidobacteriota bacterium]
MIVSQKVPTDIKIKLQVFIIFLLLQPFSTFAQAVAPGNQPIAKPQTQAELQSRLASLLDHPKFAPARWGVRIITSDGRVIFERDADKLFMPASNMKLYTTAATLDAFGPDHKFKTSVYAAANVSRNGTMKGNLILYGRGDPNLSARFDLTAEGKPNPIDEYLAADKITAIEKLADQIQARGIKVIQGDLIGDESYFATDGLGAGWEWDDLQFYYGASVSALTVNDNAVTFTVKPATRAGQSPVITVQPITSYVKIINHATTGNGKDAKTHISINRPLNSNEVEFFGNIPPGAKDFSTEIAVYDPASFAATLLKEALARRKIRVLGRLQRMDAVARLQSPFDETKLTEIASIESQPMSVLLKVINKPSQNLHTEMMLRQLGELRGAPRDLDDYGRPKSAESRGIEVLKQFLTKAGVDVSSLSLRDGSGLARQDMISPRSTSQLLLFMSKHPHFAVYRDSLPVAGDGTLQRRMKGTAAEGKVQAKTGSLSYVRALSGYVTTKKGQMLIFSLLGNNYTGAGADVTGVFDQICILLAEYENEL